jgi:hypothetical protein
MGASPEHTHLDHRGSLIGAFVKYATEGRDEANLKPPSPKSTVI